MYQQNTSAITAMFVSDTAQNYYICIGLGQDYFSYDEKNIGYLPSSTKFIIDPTESDLIFASLKI